MVYEQSGAGQVFRGRRKNQLNSTKSLSTHIKSMKSQYDHIKINQKRANTNSHPLSPSENQEKINELSLKHPWKSIQPPGKSHDRPIKSYHPPIYCFPAASFQPLCFFRKHGTVGLARDHWLGEFFLPPRWGSLDFKKGATPLWPALIFWNVCYIYIYMYVFPSVSYFCEIQELLDVTPVILWNLRIP